MIVSRLETWLHTGPVFGLMLVFRSNTHDDPLPSRIQNNTGPKRRALIGRSSAHCPPTTTP